MSPRQFIGAVGVLLALAALIALMTPMNAQTSSPFGGDTTADCGSALFGDPGTINPPACDEVTGDRRLWAIPLGAVGLIAVLGALIVETPARRRENEPRDSESA